ncbi:RING finger domain protein [Aspergillus taichungensis]|uniref:RING-type E3 ubiquitin transferase n=1 Tax=Aspergillus taichungensis TaxID=482145 RepID=A0A2J5HT25_9EURO|nr:RING finger domain protein [Aspergillus taichungensis]
MSEDVDLQQQILQRTLREVAQEEEDHEAANPCVICLEPVSEVAIAVPCKHANFDFLCLVSWLEQRRNCPLCKSHVTSVTYSLESPEGPKTYQLPELPPSTPEAPLTNHRGLPGRGFRRGRPHPHRPRSPPRPPQQPDDPLRRRQHVYRHQLYSLRVGTNRLSQYCELSPEMFNRDEALVSRARKWIRRELQVFAFLNPEESQPSHVTRPGQRRLENRRGNNAEFLLEYIVAILRTVDVKGSAGQAEELLRDFLGRDNARLFLHELQAFLRSPYMSLEDWDRHVQYDEPSRRSTTSNAGSDRTSTPVYRGGRGGDRWSNRGRVSKPPSARGSRQQGGRRDVLTQAARVQYARDRYIPD